MSSTRTGQNIDPQPIPDAEARTVPRPKTAATRFSVEELEEVESAAKRDGKSQAEWIRDTVLREARQRSASVDLVLAELSANRVIPDQIAQQVSRTTQEVSRQVGQSADLALARIEAGAEKAIRKAAVSEVGAKIESAIVGPMRTLEEALRKLRSSAVHAETASSNWRSFTNIFRWQQLAIAVLVGIVIGGAGTWYFASLPLKEAAEYILLLKNAPASPQNATQSTPSASHHIQHNQKPKSTQETQPQTEAAPVTQQP
jgi:phosphoglycolate phosphatase-like HAD superfamily hydrolase